MHDEDDVYANHPSFGTVRLSRIQSTGANLFGSAVQHHGYIMLEVEEVQSITNKVTGEMRTHATKQLLRVDMSEAQFAEFISTWNHGRGTPCTLSRRPKDGFVLESVSAPAPNKSHRETFEDVIDDSVKSVADEIRQRVDEIEQIVAGRVTKKDAERLRILFGILREHPTANLKFAQKMLHESLEKMLGRGRVEMEAAGRSLLERMGLAAVADQAKKLLPAIDFDKKNEG